MMSPSKSSFFKIKNNLPMGLQTFKAPIIQFTFNPIWEVTSIKMFEVMKNLCPERVVVRADRTETFNPKASGFHIPTIAGFKAPLRQCRGQMA